MSDALITGIIGAISSGVVMGAIEGWRRAGLAGALKTLQTNAEEHARGLVGDVEARAREAAAAAASRAHDAAAAASASTLRLGSNLGPRVEAYGERLARIEGALGLPAPKAPEPSTGGADGSRAGR